MHVYNNGYTKFSASEKRFFAYEFSHFVPLYYLCRVSPALELIFNGPYELRKAFLHALISSAFFLYYFRLFLFSRATFDLPGWPYFSRRGGQLEPCHLLRVLIITHSLLCSFYPGRCYPAKAHNFRAVLNGETAPK